MSNTDLFINAEVEYRRQRAARTVVATRGGRSRASWLRRLAAADPNLERRSS
ncbi:MULTISPECIES: hypothetical protein [Nocardioides]|uniref:Uncharacterized protein n=1 Tax=Nocardioides vastitatis TaxID=2568655 RepID=A0ABW0ZCD8_9ACTN|nr:hypothetical protein [Nocardioides sp.]